MTRVHRLQHVEGFTAPYFPQDDPVRPHAQAIDDQIALRHPTHAFEVGGPCFELADVRLLKLEFDGVLHGNDALARVDLVAERVQHRGLAAPRSAGNQNVASAVGENGQCLGGLGRKRP